MSGATAYQFRIIPLEPLLLRGHGEFDPSARGVSSSAASQCWPSPSTIMGLLASLLLRQPSARVQSWSDYVQRAHAVLDVVGISWIRGPYLVGRDLERVVPLRVGSKFCFASLERLRELFKKGLSAAEPREPGGLGGLTRELESMCSEAAEREIAQPRLVERVGIALASREGVKAVREGYLYTATLVSLGCRWIAIEVESATALARLEGAAPLGGEQRVVRVEAVSLADGERVASAELGGGYGVLLSPLVLAGPLELEARREGGRRRLYVKSDGETILEVVLGAVGVVGLGFSILERKRKPIYRAVLEGSIVKMCSGCRYTSELGAYASIQDPPLLLKLLGRTGFGSIAALECPK